MNVSKHKCEFDLHATVPGNHVMFLIPKTKQNKTNIKPPIFSRKVKIYNLKQIYNIDFSLTLLIMQTIARGVLIVCINSAKRNPSHGNQRHKLIN